MGNCSRKLKRRINSWYYSTNNGTARIGSEMFCPKCNRRFGTNTTYNTVNYHLDNCLATNDSFRSNTTAPASLTNLSHGNFLVSNNPSLENEKYVWVKKAGPNNLVIWEKVLSNVTKTVGHVENMSVKSAKKLNFEDKQLWFKMQLDKSRIPWTYGADHLKLSVHNLLETTRQGIKKVNLHKEVKIVFDEERKVNDAGGLLREFIHLISLELFGAEKGLFIKTETQETIYKMNPKIPDTTTNLELYKLAGQIIGKAIFEQITIPAQIDRFLLKQIIQEEFTLEDLATVDKSLYKSLKYIQENSITDSDVFEEYFILYSPIDRSQIELVPNGADIRITDENKAEFIKLKLDWLGRRFIQKKLDSFLLGLYQVVAPELLKAYSVEELEMIMNGLPFVDLKDWETNTAFKGLYSRNHQVIKWFWEVLKELKQEQLSKFFHFCTGSSRPPVEGFRALQSNRGEYQKFTIESVKYVKDKAGLSAHTCFNRLELPVFPKKEALRESVMNVLKTDFVGVFGIE